MCLELLRRRYFSEVDTPSALRQVPGAIDSMHRKLTPVVLVHSKLLCVEYSHAALEHV